MFRRISIALVSSAAVVFASPALATTFTTSSVSITDSINGPNVAYSMNTALNSNLTIGTPFLVDDFIKAHVDGNSFSAQSGTVTATINFSVPAGASGNVDSGTISAFLLQTAKHISITWADPIIVSFTGNIKLSVDLQNVDFDCGSSCNQKDFFIDGTFTQLASTGDGPAATPLPAAVWLMGTILGGGAGIGAWRKRRKAQPA
jgi:hypothetical protein